MKTALSIGLPMLYYPSPDNSGPGWPCWVTNIHAQNPDGSQYVAIGGFNQFGIAISHPSVGVEDEDAFEEVEDDLVLVLQDHSHRVAVREVVGEEAAEVPSRILLHVLQQTTGVLADLGEQLLVGTTTDLNEPLELLPRGGNSGRERNTDRQRRGRGAC